MTDPHSICSCSHERQEHNEGGCSVLVGSWSDGVCPCREFAAGDGGERTPIEVLHIVGLDVQVGPIRRQRCSWCGALIQEDDFSRMTWGLNADGSDPGPPGCWPVGEVVSISGEFPKVTRLVPLGEWPVSRVDGEKRLPDGCCALLDPEVTT